MKIIKPSELTSVPEIKDLTAEELAEVYALAKAAFTAEDLQRFTELDEDIPMEDVLAELEAKQVEIQKDPR